jgi:MerR family copper efflux transcriptional regulator
MVWIAEAARQTGASVKAIRLYESLGLIQPTRHEGYRYFDSAALETLRCIKLAQSLGFTLKELQQLRHPGAGWDERKFESAIALRKQDIQIQMDCLQERMKKLESLVQEVQGPHFCDSLQPPGIEPSSV